MDAAPLLKLEGVTKRYSSPDDAQAPPVLDSLCLEVNAGESVAVVGPSGSGKSTLLNVIGSLDRPSAGRVLFDGQDLARMDAGRLARLRNEQIGFVFQLHHLLPQCTVLENVLVPTLVGRNGEAHARAVELLDRVGLKERMHYRPGQISGGERQRAAVVRALINRPKVLLADEPTGSLDRQAAGQIAQLLVELNAERHVTLILVTHSASLAERMGRVLELRGGRLHAMENAP